MFKSWRVGNWGWVRLRNGKPARATYGSNAPYPIAVEFLKDDVIKCNFVNEDGFHIGREQPHDLDAIGAAWKVGDWFVIEKRPDALVSWEWTKEMDSMIGIPQQISSSTWRGIVSKDGRFWHPSWCRPCDPPKAEPAPRFQPSIEYVGIHDAI